MLRSLLKLTFLPDNRVVQARSGDTILDAALDNGIALPHECGGNCACTTCHVIVMAGHAALSVPEEVETDRISSAEGLTISSRLGCQAILRGGDVIVSIVESEI